MTPPVPGCRLCAAPLDGPVLLRQRGMPKGAQHLPDAASLKDEAGVDLDLHQCPACGLVQLGGDPVPYFREVIRAAGVSEEMRAFRREQFRAFVNAHGLEGKKILEVGCGRGEYLSLLQEQNVQASGLEFSKPSVSEARVRGLQIHQGFLSAGGDPLPDAPYDAFLILSFLEHWPDPCAGLRALGRSLAGGAVGLVEVPAFDRILERDLFTEFIPDHLCYFSRETLRTALALGGFDLLGCEEVWHGYILSATVRKRAALDLSRFTRLQEGLRAELHAFLDRFPPRRVAAWGAGHQALAVMALADLGGRLRYVVDSAPFKQGRFTPATHLPIVAPGALDEDPPDAIIIMAASYSDEVSRILVRDHPERFQIGILREQGLEILDPPAPQQSRGLRP